MVYFLYGLFFLSCLVLVAAVLLQPGKTDAGALFTSNVSSSALAPRGTATVLSKVTITAAALFMLSALLLAMPALTGNISVLNSNPEAPAESSTTNDNTAPDANANTATVPDANANSSLIEAPATDEAAKEAANAQAANGVPANALVANAPGSANKAPSKPPAKPPAKK
jgi:protein translocase SecG subunit